FRSMALHRDSVVLTYASASFPVINLANVNHIAFKDMTLEATDPDFGRVIELAGTTSFISIEGCKIKGITSGNYENVYGTYLSGKRLGFKNNLITDGYYGLYLYGDDNSTVSLDSIMIEGNTFQNTSGYMGADIYYTKNLKVRNNTFTGNMDYALSTYYVYDAMEVTRNVINITGSYGLYMYYNNGTSTAGAMIANNSIRVTGDYGIRNYYGSYQKFYNNSISVTGKYPIYVSYNSATYTNNEWRNNIFHTSGISATSYAAYIANNTSATNTWNYNLYYTASTTAFIYYTQAYTTFAAYRAAQPTQDVNSLNAVPAFTGTTNLAPAVANVNSWYMNGRGIQTTNDKDVNGNARSTTLAGGAPDLGAYEFTPAVIPPVATASPASPAAGTTQVFTLLNDTIATIAWNTGAAIPATLSVRFYSGEYAPATNASHLRTNCYWDIQETGGGVYNYNANLYYKEPMKGSIPVEADMRLAKMHNSNPWTLYTGTQSSADVSRNILSAPGLTDFSAFTGTDNANPLPVKLTSLKGIKINDDALISWTTAGETNNKGFEVQRSLDGRHFETIGFVEGNGNTNAVSNYSYTDTHVPVGLGGAVNLYYRLNQLDNNGTSSLSTVVIINNMPAHPAPHFVLYPNPFGSQVFLNIPSAEATISLIEVYDLSGKRMISLSKVLVQGENNIDLEQAASLKSGVYFVNVTVNGNREVMKLIKY
ncbi:MAG: T9SS type A sorting domain-containing protein, partial [Bacteroidota bacterium]